MWAENLIKTLRAREQKMKNVSGKVLDESKLREREGCHMKSFICVSCMCFVCYHLGDGMGEG